jgi:hypothetical protein
LYKSRTLCWLTSGGEGKKPYAVFFDKRGCASVGMDPGVAAFPPSLVAQASMARIRIIAAKAGFFKVSPKKL